MFSICFPILRERVYMLVIHWDILPQIFTLVSNAIRVLMCCIPWVTMPMDFLLNNMLFKPAPILKLQQKKIFIAIASNWTK